MNISNKFGSNWPSDSKEEMADADGNLGPGMEQTHYNSLLLKLNTVKPILRGHLWDKETVFSICFNLLLIKIKYTNMYL